MIKTSNKLIGEIVN
jgi:hypothetical protein